MPASQQGSFGKTIFLSFLYGYVGFALVIHRIFPDSGYEHDVISCWLLASAGALLGFIVASFVHEFAHFFMARFLGGFVRKIQIGSGSLLGSFSIMGTRCDVHESLRSGAIFHLLTSPQNARKKLAAITAAGPLASIALVALLIAMLSIVHPFADPSFTLWHYAFPILAGFTLPCAAFLPGILLPYRYQYNGRVLETDMLRLLTIPKITDEKISTMTKAGQDAVTYKDELDLQLSSLHQALSDVTASPNDPQALSKAISFLRAEGDSRTLEYFKRLVALPLPPTEWTEYVDQYVTCCLEWDAVQSRAHEMDMLSCKLIEADPGNISVLGTRGSILIDLGRIEEGKEMLESVLTKTTSTLDKAYANIFLALAEKQQGNLANACEHAKMAAAIDSDCPALKRVSDLLVVA